MASGLSVSECVESYLNDTNSIEIIRITTIVASTFSLFGSSFILSSYFTLATTESGIKGAWKSFFRLNSHEGITSIVAQLALADYLWSINVIITHAILLWNIHDYSYFMCILFRGWLQITAGSSVFWTASIATYLYLLILNKTQILQSSKKLWLAFNLCNWGFPTLIFSILLGVAKFQQKVTGTCFPNEPFHFSLWFIPNFLAFLYTLVTYIYILRRIYLKRKKRIKLSADVEDPVTDIRFEVRIALYLIVFVVCWVLDMGTYMYTYLSKDCLPFSLIIVYSTLLQFQGIFNAIVFGYTNRDLKQLYKGQSFGVILVVAITSPFVVFPKGVVFVIKKIKEIYNTEERPQIEEYTTGDESSSLIGRSGPSSLTKALWDGTSSQWKVSPGNTVSVQDIGIR